MAVTTKVIDPAVWTIRELNANIEREVIVVPRFQRGQVWGESQKKALIKSISDNFPIGCFLVYEDRQEGTLQIIDGLQRATAIKEFYEAPLKYYDLDGLFEREDIQADLDLVLVACHNSLIDADEGQRIIIDASKEWLGEADIYSASSFNPMSLAKAIVSEVIKSEGIDAEEGFALRAENEIYGSITESGFLDDIKKCIDLGDYAFPVIKYSGDRKNLPDIFEQLNTHGTKLNKYDILAAMWFGEDSARTLITNSAIKNAIDKKYQAICDGGFEVVDIDHEESEFTLFEYLFGVGKMLVDTDKYSILFKGGGDDHDIESFPFAIACIVYGLRLADMADLPKRIRAVEGISNFEPINPERFTAALLEGVDFVCDALRPYIGIEFQTPFVAHTEYQICSYIARAIVGKYDPKSWSVRDDWDRVSSQLKQSIPEHYLYQLLSNYWGNAGDSKLYNAVWDTEKNPSQDYLSVYTREEWEALLKSWYNNSNLKKRQTSRSAIDPKNKALLKYVYANVATAQEEKGTFHIDHIYPVKKLSEKIKELSPDDPNSEGWPISAVGNLSFFPQTLNSKKGVKTLKEFYESFDESTKQGKEKRELVKRFTLLENPSEHGISDAWGYEDYIAFLEMRHEVLTDLLLTKSLKKPAPEGTDS